MEKIQMISHCLYLSSRQSFGHHNSLSTQKLLTATKIVRLQNRNERQPRWLKSCCSLELGHFKDKILQSLLSPLCVPG